MFALVLRIEAELSCQMKMLWVVEKDWRSWQHHRQLFQTQRHLSRLPWASVERELVQGSGNREFSL